MEEPDGREARTRRRRGLGWRSTRPRILRSGEDAPLSAEARFEYRLVVTIIFAVGVFALLVAELARH